MNKIILHLLVLFIPILPLSGQEIQNASNIWYFGDRAGLDFNTSPPTVLTDGQLDTVEGVAAVSDNNGALLFYTDGITVWDRTHQAMPDANGTLNGHFSSTQSSIIIPNIDDPDIYYIFTTDEGANSDGLSYTTIDLSLPGNGNSTSPLGNVVNGQLNIQLETPVTEKLTGILKPDCTGYWVIAHGWNNNRFFAYEVTSSGVNPDPVITDIGNVHAGGSGNINAVGYMKVSVDGQKIALVNRNNGTIDVYDFDNSTGVVSNEVEIVPNDPLMYGIEFSPGGEYLYIGGREIISRYTMSTGELVNITIDNPSALIIHTVRALQLGPDENIYVSLKDKEYISAIYDPDGDAPALTVDAIFLDPDNVGRNCRFGLPNIFYRDFTPVMTDSVTMSACPGSQVEYNGMLFSAGSINEVNLMSSNGCDSVVLLVVEELEAESEFIEAEACEGSFYEYNGNQIPAGTQQSFTFMDSNGCDSIVTVQVSGNSSETFVIEVSLCEGEYYPFNNEEYPTGTDTTFYFAGQNGCDSIIDLTVTSNSPVDFILTSEASCWNRASGHINLQNITGGAPPYEYSYDGQNYFTQAVFDSLVPGMYTFSVRDANLCVFEQTIEIEEIPELQIDYSPTLLSCDVDSVLLTVELLSGNPADVDWKWPDGSGSNAIFISQPGDYTLEVSNQCQTLIENINVQTEESALEQFIYIPNAFSPNDDGSNDVFQFYPASGVEVLNCEIQIYNRWGALLFKSADVNFSWDGVFKDQRLNPGVYTWWLRANILSCNRAIELFREGDISIIR